MNRKQDLYQKQLVEIVNRLDFTITDLYHYGLAIGEEDEFLRIRDELIASDIPPTKINYLKAMNDTRASAIARIIEIFSNARAYLTERIPPKMKDMLSEQDRANNPLDIVVAKVPSACLNFFAEVLEANLLFLCEKVWSLAYKAGPPDVLYYDFKQQYHNGGLRINSKDENVHYLLESINSVLVLNAESVAGPGKLKKDKAA